MFLYFVERTLQQDMLDFLHGARGLDFHDIMLIVDGEPIGAHKVRFIRILVWELMVCEIRKNRAFWEEGLITVLMENLMAKVKESVFQQKQL